MQRENPTGHPWKSWHIAPSHSQFDVTHTPLIFWIVFNAVVLFLLALDLLVFHRKAQEVSMKEATAWSIFWVGLSLAFNALLWWWKGPETATEFLTGYLVEYSLSVDNIFVFVLVFSYFKVPPAYQHRVLFWGIIGALIMRGIMIWAGVAMITHFHWMLYLFGAFLIFTGIKMAFGGGEEIEPAHNPFVRLMRRCFPVTEDYVGSRFTTRRDGRFMLTPLAVVLVMVESTDLLFALDSIPAIIAITLDPFIIYTSNVCAILGLRSLYFLLAGVVQLFVYLRIGLAAILVFIGMKMVLSDIIHIPTNWSLAFVAFCLAVSISASVVKNRKTLKLD